jgi:hypothetical protein
LLQNGVREASKIVTLEQIGSVVNAASEVGNIKTDEGVSRAGVTSKLQGVGVGGVCDSNILEDIGGSILVGCWTTVLFCVSRLSSGDASFLTYPVFGHFLLAALPHKASWLSGNTEEALEVVAVKITTRLLLRMVGHEVDDEVVCSRYDNDS